MKNNEKLLKNKKPFLSRGTELVDKLRLFQIIFILILSIAPVSGLVIITPINGIEILEPQPLLSWTNYPGDLAFYTIKLSQTPDMSIITSTFTSNNPYYQQQTPLPKGTWYWQVTANDTNETKTPETSLITSFTLIEPPTYTITTDLTHYDTNYRVDFLIGSPVGSTVDMHITTEGFSLPFQTTDLQTTTFSTFLEPGTYTIEATFSFQGNTGSYANTIILQEPEIPTFILTFNVTDDENQPLENVIITIEGEEEDYQGTTDEEGNLTLEVQEGYYEFVSEKEDYFNDDFNKKITKDRNFRIYLSPLTKTTILDTPQLAATNTLPEPEITITTPKRKESITVVPLHVEFTISDYVTVQSCDLLYKQEDQQGWSLVDTINAPKATNILQHENPSPGDAYIKIQCKLKSDDITITSEKRSIKLSIAPDHNKEIRLFIEELSDVAKTIPSSKEPLFMSLNIQGAITNAKNKLKELDTTYVNFLKEGKNNEAEKLQKTIIEEIKKYKKELIIHYEIIDREESTLLIDQTSLKELIKDQLIILELSEKQKQTIQTKILEEQSTYTLRTKVLVVKLQTLDKSQKYVTGITRIVQNYYVGDKTAQILYLTELIPSYIQQQIGIPKILGDEGEELATIQEEKIQFSLQPDTSYTLIFSGNVKQSITSLNTILIQEYQDIKNYVQEKESNGILPLVTGKITGTLEKVGVLNASPIIWIVVAVIIAMFIVNPFSTVSTTKKNKKVRAITDTIHNTLDLLEKGYFEQAFQQYPIIIESYEQLKPPHQEQLSFAITNLSTALHTYSLNNTIQHTTSKLLNISSRTEIIELQQLTTQIILDYQELDKESKENMKPSLQQLQYHLKEKGVLLTSIKPKRNQPLP